MRLVFISSVIATTVLRITSAVKASTLLLTSVCVILIFSAQAHEKVKKFSSGKSFDLTSQARRAANSIVLNIARAPEEEQRRILVIS